MIKLTRGMRVVVPAQQFMGEVTPQQVGKIVDFPADETRALHSSVALVKLDGDDQPHQYFVRHLKPAD